MKGGALGPMIARNGQQGGCNCSGGAPQQPQGGLLSGGLGGIFSRPPVPQQPQQPNQDWRYQMSDQGGWGGQYSNPNMYTTQAQPGYRPTGIAPSGGYRPFDGGMMNLKGLFA